VITSDYPLYIKSADHKACDTADWTISLKLNWFYLRILYWLLDSLLREMYSMVKAVGLGLDYYYPWEKYSNEIYWWYTFQMDLGIQLIKSRLERDWPDPADDARDLFTCGSRITHSVVVRNYFSVSMDYRKV